MNLLEYLGAAFIGQIIGWIILFIMNERGFFDKKDKNSDYQSDIP